MESRNNAEQNEAFLVKLYNLLQSFSDLLKLMLKTAGAAESLQLKIKCGTRRLGESTRYRLFWTSRRVYSSFHLKGR